MATNLHSRREFLQLSALTGIALVTGCASSGPKPTTSSKLVGCATDGKGNYMLAATNISGELLYTHPLASRGHSVAHSQKTNHIGVFARRPGYYLDILDADSGAQLQSLEPPKDRFFYGHGVYDNDSSLLYTTEGVTDTCEGVIGIYDASNKYRRIGEWTGFGIGPHQIAQLSTGVLVIAVGGIQTHGRDKINLSSMKPQIAYLDPQSGKVLQTVSLSDHQLSIRHLAVDDKDEVFFAQQLQREAIETHPQLIMRHKLGNQEAKQLLISNRLHNKIDYIGSIGVTKKTVVASAPRANLLLVFDKASGQQITSLNQREACGIATTNSGFYTNNYLGQIISTNRDKVSIYNGPALVWDNHWSHI
ncbi:DUF1513 domain-containing protein [Vibrio ishigakensis]|uniref:DUF1513 domain-containing protein n=1 Tax=Vibrio ishigakensis TaxID=1481914 RepID=UPI0021C46802|nr:DUF1513 domain-containing protein [Vibrio ishigakensis]